MARAGLEEGGGDRAVSWVLMSAFLYYHRDETILSDGCYDELATVVREDWDVISHPHKGLLKDLTGQSTSSLYALREDDYPLIARSAALRLLAKVKLTAPQRDV
jgi:hypothetical protein